MRISTVLQGTCCDEVIVWSPGQEELFCSDKGEKRYFYQPEELGGLGGPRFSGLSTQMSLFQITRSNFCPYQSPDSDLGCLCSCTFRRPYSQILSLLSASALWMSRDESILKTFTKPALHGQMAPPIYTLLFAKPPDLSECHPAPQSLCLSFSHINQVQ